VMIGIDCIGSLKSNYHMIRTTTAPQHLIICQSCIHCISCIYIYLEK
jgi:hypothetical protein